MGGFGVAPAELEKVLLQGLCHGLRELSAQLNGHDYHIGVLYLQALCKSCIGNLSVDIGYGTPGEEKQWAHLARCMCTALSADCNHAYFKIAWQR